MDRLTDQLDLNSPGRIHLIGACGAGMRTLADVLSREGWCVTGSDSSPDGLLKDVCRGHAPDNVPDNVDLVVASDAVPPGNCERRRAQELGVPLISYAQMLGRLSAERFTLAVAGTHGKSTTVAMVEHIFQCASRAATVIYGARRIATTGAAGDHRCNSNHVSHDHSGPLLIEACEYRRNFLNLHPDISVITGIEPDHFDCYSTPQSVEHAFQEFAQRTKPFGLVLVADDVSTKFDGAGWNGRETYACESFGTLPASDWRATGIRSHQGYYAAEISHRRRPVGAIQLRVPGWHNLQNALAAAALAGSYGVADVDVTGGLNDFRGVHRRLEHREMFHGVVFYDDYAHHPTEVRASLSALRETVPFGRIWCIFQPHQASRTVRLLEDFAQALQIADNVLVADIYRAREGPVRPSPVRAAQLADRLETLGGRVDRRFANFSDATELERLAGAIHQAMLQCELTTGDVVVTMGAGNIGKVIDGIGQRIRENRAAG